MMFDLRGGRFAGSEGGLAIGEHSEEKLDDALDDIEFVRFLGSKKVHNRKDNISYYSFYYPNVFWNLTNKNYFFSSEISNEN